MLEPSRCSSSSTSRTSTARQTAYGYDDGKSRPSVSRIIPRSSSATSRWRGRSCDSLQEQAILDRIERTTDAFARLDDASWAALQAGRPDEVKRILLGPGPVIFQRAAAASQALAAFEAAQTATQDKAFKDARSDALQLLVLCGVGAGLLVFILLLTASDLARRAEGRLDNGRETEATESGLPERSD